MNFVLLYIDSWAEKRAKRSPDIFPLREKMMFSPLMKDISINISASNSNTYCTIL